MKNWGFWTIILIGILAIAIYLIYPIFKEIEVNEESPLIKDNLDSMNAEEKAEMNKIIEEMKDNVVQGDDSMPKAKVISQGDFVARAHDVKGKALLIKNGNDKILRFEDFETINGPDLRIYLSNELGIDDAVELSKIKATKGNVNYNVPSNVDTKKYNKVLVWCKQFRVLFSYAELK